MTCPIIDDNPRAIRALARAFGVARLEVFGSICAPAFEPARSDVDFLVEYPPGDDFGPWLGRRHALRRELEALLGRPVDLVTTRALRDPLFRAEADATRRLLFDAPAIAPAAKGHPGGLRSADGTPRRSFRRRVRRGPLPARSGHAAD